MTVMGAMGAAEQADVIARWNMTAAPYPHDQCIHHLFEQQAARTPAGVALIHGDERITYEALNGRANRLARHLQRLGVGPETLVGLYMERSPDAIVALLAILKAGGAYVPLDPSYPAERVAYMIEDAAPAALVTREQRAADLPRPHAAWDGRVVVVDGVDAAAIADESVENPASGVTAENAAYVIYTSGSTGQPKGVVAPHHATINRLHWMWQAYPFASGEVCCQKTALSFADSVWEIFGPLSRGVPVVVIPDAALKDADRFVEELAATEVTRLVLVPSLLRLLLQTYPDLRARLPRLTLWVSSGEALPAALCRQFLQRLPDRALLNLYGSSEVAADVTCYDTRDWDGNSAVPIGRPIANTQLHLLDKQSRPVEIGAIGELYVGGAGLARGYLRRPDLTAERFVQNPFDPDPAARLYKTGDLGRYRPDGVVEYHGRNDQQVKVRGYRVELGDIEAALAAHPGVRESVVVVRDGGTPAREEAEAGEQRVVAYIVPDRAREVTPAALRDVVAARLPAYMVPSAFVLLDALPLTPNGKVDRQALPAPDAASMASRASGALVAPATPIQGRLVELWQDLLRVRPIGVTDNFFDLGAHSLLAVRLIAEIERAFGKRLALATLFEEPTIARLAVALGDDDANLTGLAPVQPGAPGNDRRPLYFVHGDFWAGGFYTLNLARHVGADQPFYTFEQHGLHDEAVPPTIEEMAAHHVRTLRAHQPDGPYLLGGHCSAGLIAFEMARQLEEQGARVDLLALVHTAVESGHYATARRVVEPLGRLARLDDARRARLAESLGASLLRLDRLARMDRAERAAAVRGKARGLPRRGASARHGRNEAAEAQAEAPAEDMLDQRLRARRQRVNAAYIRANRRYVPRRYAGPVALFIAGDERADYGRDRTMGWGATIDGTLDIQLVPGDHVTCVTDDAHVRVVGEALRARIDRI